MRHLWKVVQFQFSAWIWIWFCHYALFKYAAVKVRINWDPRSEVSQIQVCAVCSALSCATSEGWHLMKPKRLCFHGPSQAQTGEHTSALSFLRKKDQAQLGCCRTKALQPEMRLVFPHLVPSHFPLKIPGQQLCLKSLNLGKLELNEAVITSEHICLSQQLLRKRDRYLYFKTHSTTFKMLTCEEKSHFPWVMVQTEELFVCFLITNVRHNHFSCVFRAVGENIQELSLFSGWSLCRK